MSSILGINGISCILPVYNEEGALAKVCNELIGLMKGLGVGYEIIAVDDGSTDKSLQTLRGIHGVVIREHRRNKGQSAALQTGIEASRYDVVVTLDADGQNDPCAIPQMIEKLYGEHLDMVCGWRKERKDPALKKIVSRGAYALRCRWSKDAVHDSGCTLKVMRSECAKSLKLMGEMHRLMPETAVAHGYRVGEMVVGHRPREHGQSKYGLGRIWRGGVDMITVGFMSQYKDRPMHLMGPLGVVCLLLGGGIILFSMVQKVLFGLDLSETMLLTMGMMMMLFGMQMVCFGLILEMMVRSQR